MGITTNMERGEAILEEAAATGQIIAYQIGTVYPGFKGANRDGMAQIFERHGFKASAEKLRTVDAESALGRVVAGIGKRRDSLRVDPLQAATADKHTRAFGVYRVERHPGERSSKFVLGARVFTFDGRIYSSSPVDAAAIEDCRKLAETIAQQANWLLENADTRAVSHSLTHAICAEAGAYSFIARGLYVARVGRPETKRLVDLAQELRRTYFDESTRIGVRGSAIAVVARDAVALSDAVIDDLIERIGEIEGQIREEAGNSTVKPATLQRRRESCEAILKDIDPVRALLGGWATKLAERADKLRGAYAVATDALHLDLPDFMLDEAPEESVLGVEPEASPASLKHLGLDEDAFSL
jgi:hypothetical protein